MREPENPLLLKKLQTTRCDSKYQNNIFEKNHLENNNKTNLQKIAEIQTTDHPSKNFVTNPAPPKLVNFPRGATAARARQTLSIPRNENNSQHRSSKKKNAPKIR